jgi:3-carboxy-cis,cis-muconate cycloisomerase
VSGLSLSLFGAVFAHGELARGLDDAALLQALLDVEAGLARALARAGLVPPSAAEAVTRAARAASFSSAELAAAAVAAGNPVPALVKALRAALPPSAAEAVHTGATSQDIVDSALMVLAARALPALTNDLAAAAAACARLAEVHRGTIMLGRTLLQPATPITFGLKAAGWLHALDTARVALRELGRTQLLLQFGGAAGTLAVLGARGVEVARFLAEELELREPIMPWHTQRGPIAAWAGGLGGCAAAIGKIARDITLLAQAEVGELREAGGEGRGGSSTMPHKQNPIASIAAVSCTRRAPQLVATLLACAEQEHERAAGAWHAEWEPLLSLWALAGSAAAWLRESLAGLQVDTARMRHNFDALRGLPMAERVAGELAHKLGKAAAQALVRDASLAAAADGGGLQRALAAHADELARAGVSSEELAGWLDPSGYLGSADTFIDRALAAHAQAGHNS